MDCTIATLVACFSWSNLYVDAHMTALDRTYRHQEWRVTTTHSDGVDETIGQYVWTDRADNPYGGVALGFALPIQSVTLSLEASYSESLRRDGDPGIKAVSLRAKWFPFRR